MTEEQMEPIEKVEEKEEKRKIRIVEQIDNRLAIQGQAFMVGDLKVALSIAYEIIELAETENLKSFIIEQEEFIKKIKKLLKEKKQKKIDKLRAEQQNLKLERSKKLKEELQKLEDKFNILLKTEDFEKSKEILEKAKTILSKFDDEEIKKKWEEFNKKLITSRASGELFEKAEKIIIESSELKEKFQFDELKLKLLSLITELKENNITDYLKEIEKVQTDILKAEKQYNENVQSIENLIIEIKLFQEKKKFQKAISACETLIKTAKSIKKEKIVEDYSKNLIKFQEDMKLEDLKNSVKILNDEGLRLLKKGEVKNSLEAFKAIEKNLKNYID